MRYGIFSDIHSNLEALGSVLDAYQQERIDRYHCVGDIVGYGANPKECIKIIQERKITSVAGNHDWGTSGKFGLEYFNSYAKKAVLWTKKEANAQDAAFLGNLDLLYKEDDFCLVHGTLLNPGNFDYVYDLESAEESFKVMDVSVCFVGHTHIPVTFIKDGEKSFSSQNNLINIESHKKYIVNVGSVGQPRDRDNRACFCIYDSKEKTVEIKRAKYDLQATQTKIINAGLPTYLAMRLGLGQ